VSAIVGTAATDASPPAEALPDAAVRMLDSLLASGDESRAIAGDLLVADALVTWACEAAAERWAAGDEPPEALADWCESFARRLAGTVEAAPRPAG
jgi:hypothetical protein